MQLRSPSYGEKDRPRDAQDHPLIIAGRSQSFVVEVYVQALWLSRLQGRHRAYVRGIFKRIWQIPFDTTTTGGWVDLPV